MFRQSSLGTIIPPWSDAPKAEPLLRPFKGSGRIRELGSDAWFPIEFLTYHDDRNRLHSFAYVRREDGDEILDGHYVFHLVNGLSDGRSGKAGGSSDGVIARLTKLDERNGDVTSTNQAAL